MNATATAARFTLTFEWDEFAGFSGGVATTVTETEQVTITAASIGEALSIGLAMLRDWDEGTTLRTVNPA